MKLKKLTAILMTSVFAAGMLAGCGGGGNSEGSTGTSSAGEDGGIREYTAFFAVPGTEINDDNVVQQKIAEITGAKVKETWLTGQTASEAVGTMIAGGEYPDIIDGSDGRQQLIDAGALIPLEDYLESGDYPMTDISTLFRSSETRTRRIWRHSRPRLSGFRQESWNGQDIRR